MQRKLLVACEHSGRVRDAFTAFGWDATSCDIKPADRPGKHYRGSVLDILGDHWDMMIAHPPCTYLSVCGNAHFSTDPTREQKRKDAANFFMRLALAPIPHICIENPVGCMSRLWRPSDQRVSPHLFGDTERKTTCLWLKFLPRLKPTDIVTPTFDIYGYRNKKYPTWMRAHDSTSRSRTFFGLAFAMASQWHEVE